MKNVRIIVLSLTPIAALLVPACAMSTVDFANVQRPPRPSELEAYTVFVGSWTWDA